MASEKTLEIATYYLNKHKASSEEFGLGPYLEKNGDCELYHSSCEHTINSLTIKFKDAGPNECRTAAERLYEDIKANNPEFNPRIKNETISTGQHNWVEITCPETKEVVQIDVTPWYFGLNPGHLGGKDSTNIKNGIALLNSTRGPPFAIKSYGDRFITLYLSGYTPKLAGEGPDVPEYSFCMGAIVESKHGTGNCLFLFIDVLDSTKLQGLYDKGNPILKDILESGAVKITLALAKNILLATNSGSSLEMLEKVPKVLEEVNVEKDLYDFLMQNLPRIPLFLKKIKAELPMFNDEKKKVNVRMASSEEDVLILRAEYMAKSGRYRKSTPTLRRFDSRTIIH